MKPAFLKNHFWNSKKVGHILMKFWSLSGAEVFRFFSPQRRSCKFFRSRQVLNNNLLADIGFDTAENEPLKVWRWFNSSVQLTPYWLEKERSPSLRVPASLSGLQAVVKARCASRFSIRSRIGAPQRAAAALALDALLTTHLPGFPAFVSIFFYTNAYRLES